MPRRTIFIMLAALAASVAHAQDAAHTDGDKYKVLLDNASVRVLEYRDRPGERTQQHRHPAFVLYAVSPFKRRLHLPDGRTLEREFVAGGVMHSDGQTHIGENIGSTPTHAILVEIKPQRP